MDERLSLEVHGHHWNHWMNSVYTPALSKENYLALFVRVRMYNSLLHDVTCLFMGLQQYIGNTCIYIYCFIALYLQHVIVSNLFLILSNVLCTLKKHDHHLKGVTIGCETRQVHLVETKNIAAVRTESDSLLGRTHR